MAEGGANKAAGSASGSPSNLKTRIMAAAILVPLALLVTWAGPLPFAIMVAALGALMAHEWAAMVHGGNNSQFALHAAAGIAGALCGLVITPFLVVTVALAWVASLILTAREMRGFTIYHLLGVPYMALPAFALVALRAQPSCGLLAVIFVFAAVWSADSLAYFAGRAIGGPKFAPRISPNKTWAGFGGAVTGGALAGLLVALISGVSAAPLMLLGALLGGWEQVGDLFESAAKRRFGIKDSGSLIPGHGGVLDRVDGLAAAAVLALIWGAWFTGSTGAAACGLFAWWGNM